MAINSTFETFTSHRLSAFKVTMQEMLSDNSVHGESKILIAFGATAPDDIIALPFVDTEEDFLDYAISRDIDDGSHGAITRFIGHEYRALDGQAQGRLSINNPLTGVGKQIYDAHRNMMS